MDVNKIDDRTVFYIIRELDGQYEVINDLVYDAGISNKFAIHGSRSLDMVSDCEMDYINVSKTDKKYDMKRLVLSVLNFIVENKSGPSYYFVGLQFDTDAEKEMYMGKYEKIKPYMISWFQKGNWLNPGRLNCFNAGKVKDRKGYLDLAVPNNGKSIIQLRQDLLNNQPYYMNHYKWIETAIRLALYNAVNHAVVLRQ